MANSWIYAQEGAAEKFLEIFKKLASSRRMGDPKNPQVNHGSQADKVQYEAVQKYIAIGKETGKIALGGEAQATEGSLFVYPVIFLVLPEDSGIMIEEIFGPVVVINTFKTEEATIAKTSDTEFRLYEALYTKDLNRALKVTKKLESGMTGVNTGSLTEAWDLPSEGYKGSGTGRA
jgi:aldehyde dehydrogenase (NAD+)